jgi:hypothetical protein
MSRPRRLEALEETIARARLQWLIITKVTVDSQSFGQMLSALREKLPESERLGFNWAMPEFTLSTPSGPVTVQRDGPGPAQ